MAREKPSYLKAAPYLPYLPYLHRAEIPIEVQHWDKLNGNKQRKYRKFGKSMRQVCGYGWYGSALVGDVP
jgi:hypothetical protein